MSLLNTFVDFKLDDIFEDIKHSTMIISQIYDNFDYQSSPCFLTKNHGIFSVLHPNKFFFLEKNHNLITAVDEDDIFRCVGQDTLKLIRSKRMMNVNMIVKFLDYKFYE